MIEWELPALPFFEDSHYRLAERLQRWRAENPPPKEEDATADFGPVFRDVLKRLAAADLLGFAAPAGGKADVRALCIIREALAYDSCLVDTAFIMQGLGTVALWNHGDRELVESYIGPVRRGERIAALALTEPNAGSDVASVSTTAVADGDHFVINGEKAWISNGGIADHYIVVARTGEAPGAGGLSAFIIDAPTPGLGAGPQLDMIAAHPLSNIYFDNVRVPARNRISSAGQGFKAAMAGFDIFRPTVGGAAVGLARRALAEAISRVRERRMFGRTMSEMESVQSKIAEMTADTESAALSVYRAAWTSDVIGGRTSREAALAKLTSTEAAQRVADNAVQLFGALGICRANIVENIYRDVRPMRIYEGASEVQKLIIARAMLK